MTVLERSLFGPADPHSYAALRVGLGVLAVLMYAPLLPLLALHFSDAGWLSVAAARQLPDGAAWWPSAWTPLGLLKAPWAAYSAYGGLMFSLSCFALGWHARLSGAVALGLLLIFRSRNPLLFDADDDFLRAGLFLLVLAPSDRVWALAPRAGRVEVWPLRLIQALVIVIYAVAGLEKLSGSVWRDGEALLWVLHNPAYARYSFGDLLSHPLAHELVTWATIATPWFQLLLAAGLCLPALRKRAAWAALLFHLTLFLALKLRLFSFLMAVFSLAFFDTPHPLGRGPRHLFVPRLRRRL